MLWQTEDYEILDLVEDIQTLTVQEKTSLEGEITLDEANVALKNMKNYFIFLNQALVVLLLNSFLSFLNATAGCIHC